MTAYCLNTFILFTIYLCSVLHPSHAGFNVTQPQNRTVSLQWITSITCEHDEKDASVEDVQLLGISLTDKGKQPILCQKGMNDCKNIVMHQEDHNKWRFFLLDIKPEAFNMTYQCEFTVKKDNLDTTRKGSPTILLPGQKDVVCLPYPAPPPSSSPPPPHSHQLRWILIGLLTLTLLYSCVITSFYIRLKIREDSDKGPDNSTYVEMRKAPPKNPPFGN